MTDTMTDNTTNNRLPADGEEVLDDETKCWWCNARGVDKLTETGVWVHADCECDEEEENCCDKCKKPYTYEDNMGKGFSVPEPSPYGYVCCECDEEGEDEVKNYWTDDDGKHIVLMKGFCEMCDTYIEYIRGTEKVCGDCECDEETVPCVGAEGAPPCSATVGGGDTICDKCFSFVRLVT